MAVLEAQVPVEHRVFTENPATTGRHGSSQEGTLAEPVTRYAYQIYPANWTTPRPDPINMENMDNSITNLLMDVPDPSVYHQRDTVLIHGKSFIVQGIPEFDDWGNGMQIMGEYDDMFGGTVLIRRVA